VSAHLRLLALHFGNALAARDRANDAMKKTPAVSRRGRRPSKPPLCDQG